MPYVNRTVKHPSSLYELGIFTPKYVNRTVQEAIYCMICVLTSRAQKKPESEVDPGPLEMCIITSTTAVIQTRVHRRRSLCTCLPLQNRRC